MAQLTRREAATAVETSRGGAGAEGSRDGPVVRLPAVDSTQNYAARLASNGAADGTTVVAETQTAGRGRRGRVWRDAPGESLLLSIVVRTSLPAARTPALSLAAAIAVAEALRDAAGVDARLKWPNDVQINGRKVAGILLERRGDVVVLGVGVNVAQCEFAPDLTATSIALEQGRTDRDALLAAVRLSIAHWRRRLEAEGFDVVRVRWMELATTPGRCVSVDGVVGIAVGVDDEGALVIDDHGRTVKMLAGDVNEVA